MLYLDYSRDAGGWIPNEFGGRENLEAIRFLRETNAIVGEEFPDVLMIAEESTAWPGVTAPTSAGGLGFSHKWNLGWMHDSLGYLALDPIHRAPPPQRDDVRAAVRVRRAVRPAAQPRRGRARQGEPAVQDGRRRLAAVRRVCGRCSPGRRPLPGRRCCSWAPRWRRGRSGTTLPNCRGTCWSTPRTAACTTRCRRSTRAVRRRGRPCGGVTTIPAGSSGSTPTTPTTACTRSSGGTPTAPRPSCASPTSRRWSAAGYRVGLPWAGEWAVILDTDMAAFWGSGTIGRSGSDPTPTWSPDPRDP